MLFFSRIMDELTDKVGYDTTWHGFNMDWIEHKARQQHKSN